MDRYEARGKHSHCGHVFLGEGVSGVGDQHACLAHCPVSYHHALDGTARRHLPYIGLQELGVSQHGTVRQLSGEESVHTAKLAAHQSAYSGWDRGRSQEVQ